MRAPAGTVPLASRRESFATAVYVLLPARVRRRAGRHPAVAWSLARLEIDAHGIRRLQGLRTRHGGLVRLRLPGRRVVLALDGATADRLAPAKACPAGGSRAFDEVVLETGRTIHRRADDLLAPLRDEAALARAAADRRGEIDWRTFDAAWSRAVRRLVLGGGAGGDEEVTDLLRRLSIRTHRERRWVGRNDPWTELEVHLVAHLARADARSLAGQAADTPRPAGLEWERHVARWLSAFDAAGIVTHQTLALLAAHPGRAAEARAEVAARSPGHHDLPKLRSCVLEAARLWPPSPLVLHPLGASPAPSEGPALPTNTTVAVSVALLQRDDEVLEDANRFAPERWSTGSAPDDRWTTRTWCAARDVVLLAATAWLAEMVADRRLDARPGGLLRPDRPIPRTLDPFQLRIGVAPLPVA